MSCIQCIHMQQYYACLYFYLQSNNTDSKLQTIHDEVQREIEDLCLCGFTTKHLSDSQFQCLTNSDEVMFRGRLNGTAHSNSSELIRYIDQWLLGGNGTICVEGTKLTIDSTCQPVMIANFSDPAAECDTIMSDDRKVSFFLEEMEIIIAGGAVGGVVLVVAVIVIALLLRSCHAKLSQDKESG